jgi:hypothetical protein
MSRHRRIGFTLVELLSSSASSPSSFALLLPTLAKAREQANRTACLSNLRQLALAAIQYSQAYKAQLPIESLRADQPHGGALLFSMRRISPPTCSARTCTC